MFSLARAPERRRVKCFKLVFLLLLSVFLAACSFGSGPEKKQPAPAARSGGPLLLVENDRAGDALGDLLQSRLGSSSGVLVASLVELGNLEHSSRFGQLCAQQIGSRLSQRGFKVLESRLGAELRLGKDGEFMLTSESARLLAREHNAGSALLGVYSESRRHVFVSVRVVRLNDNAVIAAHEYSLPKNNEDVSGLLSHSAGGGGASQERVWAGFAAREPAFKK